MASGRAPAENRLVLTARIVATGVLRHTPAGIPALDLTLEHESLGQEAGQQRQVQVQVKSVALGVVAERLVAATLGAHARFEGFIAGSRRFKGIVFHIQAVEDIEANPTD